MASIVTSGVATPVLGRKNQEGNVNVDTTAKTLATLLHTLSTKTSRAHIQNLSATVNVYIGMDNTVTADDGAAGGWVLEPRDSISFPWPSVDLDDLYFIVAAGTARLKIIEEKAR